jgi:Uma2 family endonuclease
MVTRPNLKRHRFNVDEYHRMAKAGILHEDDRIELIEGELIEMAAVGSRHMACVNDLNRLFVSRLGDRAIVSIQNPVCLSFHSEPEPDLSILRPHPNRYRDRIPLPEDVLLLIEVADTTFAHDRAVKLPLYAAAGIPEVWIADLPRRRFLLHRTPEGNAYTDVTTVRRGTISPLAFPDVTISIESIFD